MPKLTIITASLVAIGIVTAGGAVVYAAEPGLFKEAFCGRPVPVLSTDAGYGSHHGNTTYHELGDSIEIQASVPGCSMGEAAWEWHVTGPGGFPEVVTRGHESLSVDIDLFAAYVIYALPLDGNGDPMLDRYHVGSITPQVRFEHETVLTGDARTYEWTAPFVCCTNGISVTLEVGPNTVAPAPDVMVRLLGQDGRTILEHSGSTSWNTEEIEAALGAEWIETLTLQVDSQALVPAGFEVLVSVATQTHFRYG